jgi:hypothetical protein
VCLPEVPGYSGVRYGTKHAVTNGAACDKQSPGAPEAIVASPGSRSECRLTLPGSGPELRSLSAPEWRFTVIETARQRAESAVSSTITGRIRILIIGWARNA